MSDTPRTNKMARRLDRDWQELSETLERELSSTIEANSIYAKKLAESEAEVARLNEDNYHLAAIAAVPSTDREWRAERANDSLKAEVARLREALVRIAQAGWNIGEAGVFGIAREALEAKGETK